MSFAKLKNVLAVMALSPLEDTRLAFRYTVLSYYFLEIANGYRDKRYSNHGHANFYNMPYSSTLHIRSFPPIAIVAQPPVPGVHPRDFRSFSDIHPYANPVSYPCCSIPMPLCLVCPMLQRQKSIPSNDTIPSIFM